MAISVGVRESTSAMPTVGMSNRNFLKLDISTIAIYYLIKTSLKLFCDSHDPQAVIISSVLHKLSVETNVFSFVPYSTFPVEQKNQPRQILVLYNMHLPLNTFLCLLTFVYLSKGAGLYDITNKSIYCTDVDTNHILNLTCNIKAVRGKKGIYNLYWIYKDVDNVFVSYISGCTINRYSSNDKTFLRLV